MRFVLLGVELVVWVGIDEEVEGVRMLGFELCTICVLNFLIVGWSSSLGLGVIPPLEDVELGIGLLCKSNAGLELLE